MMVVMVAPLTFQASPGSSARTRRVALPPLGTVTLAVFVDCQRLVPSDTTSCAGVMVYGPAPLAQVTVTSRALYCAATRSTSNTEPASSVSHPPSAVSRYPPRATCDTTPRRSRRASASATARVRRALPACHAVTGRPSAASVASSASSSWARVVVVMSVSSVVTASPGRGSRTSQRTRTARAAGGRWPPGRG